MIKKLVKIFIKDYKSVADKKVREKYGVLAGTTGIICNIVLFIIKITVGMVVNSIAIISDGFNNLSDMASSIVSIVGMKLSGIRPDREHPFGHGRIEYISALIISFIIMLVGFELFKTSLNKIWHPEKPTVSAVTIGLLLISVGVKVWMFSFNRYIGKEINSEVFKATAQDSINDVIATIAIIISAVWGLYTDIPIDGIAGCIVSSMVVFTGFKIAKNTIGILLGSPPNPEMVSEISDIILSQENIVGFHDLIIHDYGPGRIMASVHAEVPSNIGVDAIHNIIDATEKYIYETLDVHIVIHMDPIQVNCEKLIELKKVVSEIVKSVNSKFNIHDFRIMDSEKNVDLIFDLEVPCEMSQAQRDEVVIKIKELIKNEDEKYRALIIVDNIF